MGTFATVRMALDLTKRTNRAPDIATTIVDAYPGTRNVTLDAATGTLDFELYFPGNLSALVRELSEQAIFVRDRPRVSFPVLRLGEEPLDATDVAQSAQLGPEVWDPQFERGQYVFDARLNGDRLEASIAPSTSSMHELYDGLLDRGLVASDSPERPAPGI